MTTHLAPKVISWASIIDSAAADQIIQASKMPFIYPHIAVMPDVHLGKGCSVGTVLPTKGAIIPAAVGVDIGCGMIAVRTQWTRDEFVASNSLVDLRHDIERAIPLSPGKYNKELTETAEERVESLVEFADFQDADMPEEYVFTPDTYARNWHLQLGSLGGGNHFIEVTVDEEERTWLFLHSGSRGVGNKIAQHHIKAAEAYCDKNWITLPHRDLAYLVEDTAEFDQYIAELRWAQAFALANREEMMDRLVAAAEKHMGEKVVEAERINCHHNFTEHERHFGQDVWLSRKGAINAAKGVKGLIPGSMGTASYVVTGLGNRASFNSSPHGAGREHGRNQAKRLFTLEQLQDAMKGIEWSGSDAFIDEIPQAYKDIDAVMTDSADLVEVNHKLSQILNVKGT
jgi:tRNA-splicing ligase RtcB